MILVLLDLLVTQVVLLVLLVLKVLKVLLAQTLSFQDPKVLLVLLEPRVKVLLELLVSKALQATREPLEQAFNYKVVFHTSVHHSSMEAHQATYTLIVMVMDGRGMD